MPLFGLRKNKKNEQSQTQTAAGEAKAAASKSRSVKSYPGSRQALAKGNSGKAGVAKVDTNSEKKNVSEVATPSGSFSGASGAIIRPHVTEKSGLLSQGGVYTFQVAKGANKHSVARAINALYKIRPIKVSIINAPAKKVFVRGKRGMVAGFRKAMVTVKKGDKIDFV